MNSQPLGQASPSRQALIAHLERELVFGQRAATAVEANDRILAAGSRSAALEARIEELWEEGKRLVAVRIALGVRVQKENPLSLRIYLKWVRESFPPMENLLTPDQKRAWLEAFPGNEFD